MKALLIRTPAWLVALFLAVCLCMRPSLSRASEAVEALLFQAQDSALRARLLDHARQANDSLARGEAWYYAGLSYQRAGIPDSAIRCFERAVAFRGGGPELDGLSDALTLRGASGDAARAIELSRLRLDQARLSSEAEIA